MLNVAHSLILVLLLPKLRCEEFTLGYLTGSQRLPGDKEYARPGLTISGAISLAVSEINAPDGLLGSRGHSLSFIVAETYGEEAISIRQTASLWTRNVSAYIGPQETCTHEGRMAAAFDIVMISYFCTDYETSDKTFFPTFARTRPPISQISKSVAAVLLAFQWSQVAFFYLNSPEYAEFGKIASSIIGVLESVGILVTFRKWWDAPYHHGYSDNPFVQMIRDTYAHVRIYVILGHYYEHLGLMVAMEEMGLFDKGEYFVVGVDIEQYDSRDPEKYLRGMLLDNPDPVAQAAYRSYIGVLPSAARGYENFTEQVNYYCEQPPFNFVNPLKDIGANKIIRPEAAYLYDAVYLYANALVSTMEANESTSNTTAIMQRFFQGDSPSPITEGVIFEREMEFKLIVCVAPLDDLKENKSKSFDTVPKLYLGKRKRRRRRRRRRKEAEKEEVEEEGGKEMEEDKTKQEYSRRKKRRKRTRKRKKQKKEQRKEVGQEDEDKKRKEKERRGEWKRKRKCKRNGKKVNNMKAVKKMVQIGIK
ncbi:hypothetical protein M8J76_016997 [Diaphorina citri]|nr:hypothetical protein M8J76_016997 [Diaphorina citri]